VRIALEERGFDIVAENSEHLPPLNRQPQVVAARRQRQNLAHWSVLAVGESPSGSRRLKRPQAQENRPGVDPVRAGAGLISLIRRRPTSATWSAKFSLRWALSRS
jgi:hypothetical protein